MSVRVFFEDWIRGDLANIFRKGIRDSASERHPHVTFFQPGHLKEDLGDAFIEKIVKFCTGKPPIKYFVEGSGNFGKVTYAPVKSTQLLKFNNELEKAMKEYIVFDEKLSDQKVLHVTYDNEIDSYERMEFVMLRLTCIRGEGIEKRIFFSFDFVTQELLDREQSLDEARWQRTRELYLASC